jgi:hypothetical protein
MTMRTRHTAKLRRRYGHARVFPPGATVYVDGEQRMKVLQAFPEGSTSYLFPHYQLGPAHRRILSTDEIETVAMNRVGVVKKKRPVGLTAEEKRWAEEYDRKHPLGTLEEARAVAEQEAADRRHGHAQPRQAIPRNDLSWALVTRAKQLRAEGRIGQALVLESHVDKLSALNPPRSWILDAHEDLIRAGGAL